MCDGFVQGVPGRCAGGEESCPVVCDDRRMVRRWSGTGRTGKKADRGWQEGQRGQVESDEDRRDNEGDERDERDERYETDLGVGGS
jgi:hypothetical protein